ncbi:hypothetical protein MKL09_08505, partial [Methylobacterium sp. J-048]|uniref:hypothetical protein n=1 Tax=Methylobacterium sp. J-048 TaxID=2836635 RepID=UPI001FB903A2
IHLQDGDVVELGDYIVDGNPAPHDILAIKGVEELAAYLVNEIQEVYRVARASAGVGSDGQRDGSGFHPCHAFPGSPVPSPFLG